MSKEDVCHCSHCGAEISDENYTLFDNEVLCPSCLERETLICEHCGERIWSEENAGNSSTVLCQDCFDDHYINCERCECIIHNENANTSFGIFGIK